MKLQVHRAEEITRLHQEIIGSLRTSLAKGIQIGELLTEQKESLKHGEFTSWIKENLPFTDRTARNYMRLHQRRDELKTESVSDLTDAYKLLSAPKETHEVTTDVSKEEMREKIVNQFRIEMLRRNPWLLEEDVDSIKTCINNINEEIGDPAWEMDLPCRQCSRKDIGTCFKEDPQWFLVLWGSFVSVLNQQPKESLPPGAIRFLDSLDGWKGTSWGPWKSFMAQDMAEA